MSVMAHLLKPYLRLTEKRGIARAADPGILRRRFERSARIFFHPPKGTQYRETTLDGSDIDAIHVTPKAVRDGPLILYLHGGGYVFGSPHTHKAMLAQLAARTGLSAVLPRYRLGPEHPFPAAPDDALAAFRAVLDHPGGVIIGGDSAGGGLALSLLGQICALGLPQPRGTFCFSPLTDVTFSGASFRDNAAADVILPASRANDMAQMYLAGANPRDPRISPLYANLAGVGPVWMCVGDTEILLDDSRRMAEHLMAQGVDVTCVIERDLPHVWPLMHMLLPEARQTLNELAGWITALSRL